MERVARRRCKGAVTVNLPASTEDLEIISCYSDLTSLLTPLVVLVAMPVKLT